MVTARAVTDSVGGYRSATTDLTVGLSGFDADEIAKQSDRLEWTRMELPGHWGEIVKSPLLVDELNALPAAVKFKVMAGRSKRVDKVVCHTISLCVGDGELIILVRGRKYQACNAGKPVANIVGWCRRSMQD